MDEAGKLAAFRERYGRGWDLESKTTPEEEAAASLAAEARKKAEEDEAKAKATEAEEEADPFDSLTDLISGYATPDMNPGLNVKETGRPKKK